MTRRHAPPDRFPRVLPFGEAALLVELGDRRGPAANARVHALAVALDTAPAVGQLGLVPAYASLLVEFDPLEADPAGVEAVVRAALETLGSASPRVGRRRTVPTVFGGAFGPDLEAVAGHAGLRPAQVVERLAAVEQTVYMLGFSPGFPYLGDLPAELAVPRLQTPRERVPAGSVAVAGRQTGIYPRATPGGWRLVGRTPIALFDAWRDPPAYFAPGDRVRFVPIRGEDWDRHTGPPADW